MRGVLGVKDERAGKGCRPACTSAARKVGETGPSRRLRRASLTPTGPRGPSSSNEKDCRAAASSAVAGKDHSAVTLPDNSNFLLYFERLHAILSPMKHGFSLVELSIVLVILGLLTGGILTGQSLIRAAELRSVITEFKIYQTAVLSFRDKYFALPGDMKNATDFWGAAHSSPSTCGTTASSDTHTCNGDGDGDGVIEDIGSSSTGSHELYRAWQHLSNAGLIEGRYSGVKGPGAVTWDAVIGENIPASKLGNAGWAIHQAMSVTGHAHFFDKNYGTRLQFGADITNGTVNAPVLTPKELWNFDTKIDDGLPGKGDVMTLKSTSTLNPNCATTSSPTTAEYNLLSDEVLCSIVTQPGW